MKGATQLLPLNRRGRWRQEILAGWGLVERNFSLLRRYLSWEVVDLFYNVVNALTIAFIGVGQGPQVVLYLVIGALLWGFLSVLFNEVAQSVQWERWEGTIEYTFMAPIHRLTYLLGASWWAVLYGLLRTTVVLLALVSFLDLQLEAANLLSALLVLCVSSFSFIGLGLIAAVLPLMSPEKGSQAAHIVQGFILLISGVYYDVSVLPRWLQPLSALSPATYTLRAERAALLQGAGLAELLPDLLRLAGFAFFFIPVGYLIFRAGEMYALRTGKLKRNG
ncbi:MAG: ABC transporter permease [Limnochordales bacterium]|nr:ABC transporter permease [Limnochordales bacterium]